MNVHPQSFRALAFEVQNHLYNSGATDDSRITLPLIEQELRNQYGTVLAKQDQARLRMGQDIDPARLKTQTLDLLGDGSTKQAAVKGFYSFNGYPYITFVGRQDSGIAFVPGSYRWQLKSLVVLNRKPAYVIDGSTLFVELTSQTILMEKVDVIGVPLDPFPEASRGDDWYWATPWNVSQELKAEVKMQTLRVFMGTHVLLQQQRTDKKNNGTEG